MLGRVQGRISQDFEHFLIAPFGTLHHEVTASSLVKVDMRGDVLDVGAAGIGLGVNKLGFSLHAAVYASRPDIKCIAHLRCPNAVAVSCLCQFVPRSHNNTLSQKNVINYNNLNSSCSVNSVVVFAVTFLVPVYSVTVTVTVNEFFIYTYSYF